MTEEIDMSKPTSQNPSTLDLGGLEFDVIPVAATGARRQDQRALTWINGALGFVLSVVVFAAAIPAASNRPIYWLFWSGLILLILSVYLMVSWRMAPERRLRVLVDRQWLAPTLAMLCAVGVVLQTFPVPFDLYLPTGLGPKTISLYPEASQLGLIRILGYIAFFILMLEISARRQRAERIAWVIFGAICLHAAWAMVSLRFMGDTFFWGEKTAYQGVATGTFINRNSFATFLGMGFILGLGLLWSIADAPRIRKSGTTAPPKATVGDIALPLLGLILIGSTLFETQSRMGVFATILGSAVAYLILQVKSGRGLLKHGGIVILAGSALVAIWLRTSGTGLFDRLLMVENNSVARVELWAQVLELIKDRPWTGFGWDTFAPAFELYHHLPLSSDRVWEYSHNSYLNLWAELGIIAGSLPPLAALVIALRLIRQIHRAEANFALSVVALAVLMQCALHSLVDFSLEMPANMYLFLAILGLGSAARRQVRSSQ